MNEAKTGFEKQKVRVSVGQIISRRIVNKDSHRYRVILESVRKIGVIEPLLVAKDAADSYSLLDGECRLAALKDLGGAEVECVVAHQNGTSNE